jgi:hypothetical protein
MSNTNWTIVNDHEVKLLCQVNSVSQTETVDNQLPPSSSLPPNFTLTGDMWETLKMQLSGQTQLLKSLIEQNERQNLIIGSLNEQNESLKSLVDQQNKILKDIRILRFDQEAIIKSMVTDGKKIELDFRPDDRNRKSFLPFTTPFSFQRDLNWSIRSRKPSPFVAEHSDKAIFNNL